MKTAEQNAFAYGSSLRSVPVEITLARAAKIGATLGITRVTNITRLDRIGIPVYASIRPSACEGSFCVNAGKGLSEEEARASAWMEAIEFALAEPGRSSVPLVMATAREVLDGATRPDAILDFCPMLGTQIPPNRPMPCASAECLLTQRSVLVPAELVFFPAPPECEHTLFFGASTNGLASGNTLLEATVHGIAEVMERHIHSMALVSGDSLFVPPETFPPAAAQLAQAIRNAGLDLYVRHQPNEFGMPYFEAILHDQAEESMTYLNGGFGCHPHRQIALIRAICEAAQSRLSMIHGGRDDLHDIFLCYAAMAEEPHRLLHTKLLDKARRADRVMAFDQVTDWEADTPDLASCYTHMVCALQRIGINHICRIVFTRPEDPLQVAKLLVPTLEDLQGQPIRVGKRLRDYVTYS